APLDEVARVRPQPHRAAQVRHLILLVEQADHRVPAVALDLRRVGVLQLDDVPRELDHRTLESEADAEEGDGLLPGEADGLDLAGDAAVAEAARHQDAVDAAQAALGPLALDLLRLDAADDDPAVQRDAGVVERLVDRLVGVLVLDVLADDSDADLVLRVEDAVQHGPPVADVERLGPQVEL